MAGRFLRSVAAVCVLVGVLAVPVSVAGAEGNRPHAGEPMRFGDRSRNPELSHCAVRVTVGPEGVFVQRTRFASRPARRRNSPEVRPATGGTRRCRRLPRRLLLPSN